MTYDEELAGRIRAIIGARPLVRERKMFGGLAFLIGGNMAVAASRQGGLLVRADPNQAGELVSHGVAEPMMMRGRPMAGWLLVDADAVRADEALSTWVERGAAYATSLPVKEDSPR